MQELLVIGRLTKDPELRYSNKNKAYTVLNVAVNNSKDSTSYFDFVCYDKAAENHVKFLKKGSLAFIKGTILNKVTERDGKKIYGFSFFANNVVYLEYKNELKKSETEIQETIKNVEQPQPEDPFSAFGNEIQLSEDDLPF